MLFVDCKSLNWRIPVLFVDLDPEGTPGMSGAILMFVICFPFSITSFCRLSIIIPLAFYFFLFFYFFATGPFA